MKEAIAEAESPSKQMNALIAFRLQAQILQGPSDELDCEPKFEEQKPMTIIRSIKAVPLQIFRHVKLNATFENPSSIIKNLVNVPGQTEETFRRKNLKINMEKSKNLNKILWIRKDKPNTWKTCFPFIGDGNCSSFSYCRREKSSSFYLTSRVNLLQLLCIHCSFIVLHMLMYAVNVYF